jgi:hypothetical protein
MENKNKKLKSKKKQKTKRTNWFTLYSHYVHLGAFILWVRESLEVDHKVCSKFYDPMLAKEFALIILVFVTPILFLNKEITTLFWFVFSFIIQKC